MTPKGQLIASINMAIWYNGVKTIGLRAGQMGCCLHQCHAGMCVGVKFHNDILLWHGSTFCISGHLWGKPPVTGGFPSQRDSNEYTWWCRATGTYFPHYWSCERIYQGLVESSNEGTVMQIWSLTFPLLLASTTFWTNNRVASDLRCHDTYVRLLWS